MREYRGVLINIIVGAALAYILYNIVLGTFNPRVYLIILVTGALVQSLVVRLRPKQAVEAHATLVHDNDTDTYWVTFICLHREHFEKFVTALTYSRSINFTINENRNVLEFHVAIDSVNARDVLAVYLNNLYNFEVASKVPVEVVIDPKTKRFLLHVYQQYEEAITAYRCSDS